MSRAGIFGWSYPPGCSGPPDDGPEPPCPMCGEYEAACKCTECRADVVESDGTKRECGVVGCLEHMSMPALLWEVEKMNYLSSERKRELDRRSIEQAVTCEKCGAKIPKNFIDGMEFCDKCQALVGMPADADY